MVLDPVGGAVLVLRWVCTVYEYGGTVLRGGRTIGEFPLWPRRVFALYFSLWKLRPWLLPAAP